MPEHAVMNEHGKRATAAAAADGEYEIEQKHPRRGRRRKGEIEESNRLMNFTKVKQEEFPTGEGHGLLDRRDHEVETTLNNSSKADMLDEMKLKITESLDEWLSHQQFPEKLATVETLLAEELRLEEEYRRRVSANFYRLSDKAKDSQVFDRLSHQWNGYLPEVGKSYCADFLRPPHPFNPLERMCCRQKSGRCVAKLLATGSRNDHQTGTTTNAATEDSGALSYLREFLLPEQKERVLREKTFDFAPRPCLLCNRFITTFLVYQAMYYKQPVAYLIQDHRNTIGGPDGYDIQNCFPVVPSGSSFYGIAFPMVKYHSGDMISKKQQGDHLDMPYEQLKEIWSAMSMGPMTVEVCDNILRATPHLSHCRSQIIRGVSELSTPIFRIKRFPRFIESEMKADGNF